MSGKLVWISEDEAQDLPGWIWDKYREAPLPHAVVLVALRGWANGYPGEDLDVARAMFDALGVPPDAARGSEEDV